MNDSLLIVVIAVLAAALVLVLLRRRRTGVALGANASAAPRPPEPRAVEKLLVPVTSLPYSGRGVELACRLAAARRSEVDLVYVIEIPRNVPLATPRLEDEERAAKALAAAAEQVKAAGLKPVTRVERAREAGEAIVKAARELEASAIVVGMRFGSDPTEPPVGTTIETLLRRAPCEVIVARVAGADEE